MSVSGSLYSLVAVVPPENADSTEEENILGLLVRKKPFEIFGNGCFIIVTIKNEMCAESLVSVVRVHQL
jgi:hypothetical protein